MEVSNSFTGVNQQSTLQRSESNSTVQREALQNQKQTQSVDKVTTEQPVQKSKALNEDVVNARVSEHQALASGNQVTADEAVGSLVDVRV